MSVVWVMLLVGSFLAAGANGKMSALAAAIATSAQSAVTLSLGLVGVMALWLGLMRVAEEAGLVGLLARGARPVLRRLFPEVPDGHPAMGAMVMNVAANMLGLGNAATPFGLEAMRRLDELNPARGTASDAQVLFCALNTASIQMIPATVIALRAAAGAHDAADVIAPVIAASACAAAVAIASARVLARLYPNGPSALPAVTAQATEPVPGEAAGAVPGDPGGGAADGTTPDRGPRPPTAGGRS